MTVLSTLISKVQRTRDLLSSIIRVLLPLSMSINLLILSTDQIPIDVSWRCNLFNRLHTARLLISYSTIQKVCISKYM